MSRKPSPSVRTTLYRLSRLPDLASALRSKYREDSGFSEHVVVVGDREALLLVGEMTTERASWADQVAGITGAEVNVGNVTSAGVLVIQDDEEAAWALAYGMGFQLLDPAYIDPSFGQRIALRTADPMSLRSVTRTTLDQRARTDRSSIPGGEHLRGFGLGDFGEIVSRLVSKAHIPSLAVGKSAITIRGADALSVPIGRTSDLLLRDLDSLKALLDREPIPGLEMLEQLVAVRNQVQIEALEEALAIALGNPQAARIGLGWPHERIDENGVPSSFTASGAGRTWGQPNEGVPDLDRVLECLAASRQPKLIDAAKKVRIQLFRDADGTEAISPEIPALNWLAFETDLEGHRFALHDGRWYRMDDAYAARVQSHVDEIFARDSGLTVPDWDRSVDPDEQDYNRTLAKELGGVLLDRDLIRTTLHHRGIEACDVLTAEGVPIHVKNLDGSSAASHLLAQALVSVDALRFDEDARRALGAKISASGGDPGLAAEHPRSVVLVVASERPITAANLFTFTQVTIARLDSALAAAGITVFIVPVRRFGVPVRP